MRLGGRTLNKMPWIMQTWPRRAGVGLANEWKTEAVLRHRGTEDWKQGGVQTSVLSTWEDG